MAERVCVISGVGPGTGAACARRFAAGGYRVAMLARNLDRLRELERQLPASVAWRCDVSDEKQVNQTVAEVRQRLGPASVLIHNAVGGSFGDFLQIAPADLERNFRVNTMGFLYLARAVAPDMLAAGAGAIIATGNTSAMRGKANFAGFAPTKAALRVLAQSVARAVGPRGVHVAHVIIDAVIDVPWTRERMKDKPDDFFAKPSAIAETIWNVAHQDRSAWSFRRRGSTVCGNLVRQGSAAKRARVASAEKRARVASAEKPIRAGGPNRNRLVTAAPEREADSRRRSESKWVGRRAETEGKFKSPAICGNLLSSGGATVGFGASVRPDEPAEPIRAERPPLQWRKSRDFEEAAHPVPRFFDLEP